MVEQLRLSEEHGRSRCDSDRDFLPVVFEKYDSTKHMMVLAPCFWKFQYFVNHDDYSGVQEVGGVPFTALELYLCQLKAENCQFQMAMNTDGTICLGFLMYHLIADCILFIRGMYVEPGLESQKIGLRLVQSLGRPIQKIIFQTQVGTPPDRLLVITQDKNRKKIWETDKLITWEMDWRG